MNTIIIIAIIVAVFAVRVVCFGVAPFGPNTFGEDIPEDIELSNKENQE